MRTLNSPEIHRNMGFVNEATQQALLDTEVAIAGNGGTGNMMGMQLARFGIQNFVIADPEVFDDVNSNRVMGARVNTIGRNKAEVLKEDILEINPEANVRVYNEGINEENIEEFLHSADIALNGTELTMPQLGVMLAREARNRTTDGERNPLPILDVEYIAHAGQATSFDPNSKMTFERFMGIKDGQHAPEDIPLDVIADMQIDPSRYLAYLPAYGDIKTFLALKEGAPLPSNMAGASQAATIGVAETLKHVRVKAGQRGLKPTYAPKVRWMDSYTGKSGETNIPRLSHYRSLTKVAMFNVLKLNEPASYTTAERAARGDFNK